MVNRIISSLLLTIFWVPIVSADTVYSLVNLPTDQDGAQLVGEIVTDGSLSFIGENNIVSWSFTVNKAGATPYTRTSSDARAFFDLPGNFSLIATPTELQLNNTLRIGNDFDGGTSETSITWDPTGVNTLYASILADNASPNGWFTPNPVGFGPGSLWTIGTATAVPEPSSALLIGTIGIFWGLRRHRRRINTPHPQF